MARQQPDKVVAVIDGKQITARQALDLLKPFSAEERKRYESNLPALIQQIYMREQLADQAAKLNLDQQSPWKEQIQMARASILSQAYLNHMTATGAGAAPEDPQQYYNTHPDEFDQVELSGIFVAFSPPGTPAGGNGNVARTEEQARAKADDIEKKIKSGGDFGALARTESDNQQAAAHGGSLGTYSLGDAQFPPDMKSTLAKMQTGQVSEPVRIPGAFLILKVDSRTKLPFETAKNEIIQKQQNQKTQSALKQEMDKYKIQVQDPDFFSSASAPAPRTPSLQRPGSAPPAPAPPKSSPQR